MAIKKMKGNDNNESTNNVREPQKTPDRSSPFSQEYLNDIFKISPTYSDRIISRESSDLEFKETFGWKSLPKYLKTCAAFANAKGGYVVFGIGRRPHKLIGLAGNSLKSFQSIDPEKITNHFNEHFSPEIVWDIHEYELDGKVFGLLYVHESHDKPLICTKDAESILKEGDIYYRYRGRSERIKYPEMRFILDLTRENEQRLWMQHLAQIARIGIRETGIFDLKTGQVTGTSGSFLIDESLLSQLTFIKEGEFSEVKGKPSLRLIGSAEVIAGSISTIGRKHIVKTKGIRIADIVLAFLNLERVNDPVEYLKQVCFENTAFLPIYFFMHLGKLDSVDAIGVINNVVCRNPAKSKLIERLQNDATQRFKISGTSPSALKKQSYHQQLKQKKVNEGITGKDLEYCLDAVRSLSPGEIKQNSPYIRSLLRTMFNKHYTSESATLANNIRRAICWIDEALYRKDTK